MRAESIHSESRAAIAPANPTNSGSPASIVKPVFLASYVVQNRQIHRKNDFAALSSVQIALNSFSINASSSKTVLIFCDFLRFLSQNGLFYAISTPKRTPAHTPIRIGAIVYTHHRGGKNLGRGGHVCWSLP
jgi:hypothetical protein